LQNWLYGILLTEQIKPNIDRPRRCCGSGATWTTSKKSLVACSRDGQLHPSYEYV